MLKKIVRLLAATAFLVVFAGAAQAAEHDEYDEYSDDSADKSFWGLGARFAWDNHKDPIYVYNEENNPGLPAGAYGGQNFGGMILWGISDQLVLNLSVDVGFWSHNIHPYTSSGVSEAVNVNYFTIGAMIGAKYYVTPPESRSVRLYLHGGVGYYFSKAMNSADVTTVQNQVINNARAEWASTSNADCNSGEGADGICQTSSPFNKVPEEDYITFVQGQPEYAAAEEADTFSQDKFDAEVDTVSRLASPIVLQLAVGAEFFVSNNFSIGADIIGLRGEFSWADVGKIEQTFTGDPWTGDQRIFSLYFYSAITMSFNLTGPAEAPIAYGAPAGAGAPASSTTGWTGGGAWTAGPAAPSATTPKSQATEAVAPDASINVTASDDEPPPPPPAAE